MSLIAFTFKCRKTENRMLIEGDDLQCPIAILLTFLTVIETLLL